MFDKLTTQTTYKIILFIGLAIVAVSPFLAWKYISNLEQAAVTIFEQSILNRLDLESTQLHYQSVQNVIAASQKTTDDPDAIDYSSSEMEHLQTEAVNLSDQIAQLKVDAGVLASAKTALITDIKIILVIIFIVMLVAMLLAAFGLLGWYFHIRIFQERRNESRQERITDTHEA